MTALLWPTVIHHTMSYLFSILLRPYVSGAVSWNGLFEPDSRDTRVGMGPDVYSDCSAIHNDRVESTSAWYTDNWLGLSCRQYVSCAIQNESELSCLLGKEGSVQGKERKNNCCWSVNGGVKKWLAYVPVSCQSILTACNCNTIPLGWVRGCTTNYGASTKKCFGLLCCQSLHTQQVRLGLSEQRMGCRQSRGWTHKREWLLLDTSL